MRFLRKKIGRERVKDYAAPAGVQDVNTILAGTRAFSPDEWEVFYIE